MINIIKKTIFLTGLFVIIQPGYSENPEENIRRGNDFFNQRNILKNKTIDSEQINKAIYHYEKALAIDPANEEVWYKYSRAVDFKYSFLKKQNTGEKEKKYKELIVKLEEQHKKKKESKYLNYALALIWGRYGQMIGVLSAAKNGVGTRIKEYGETLYKVDKHFNNCAAGILLGRLHYKAPYIPLILSWPDKKKSEKYLTEVVENCLDNFRGKFYLADTLYELDKKEMAEKYFNEVFQLKPREETYLEDKDLIQMCKMRMTELGLLKKK